MTPSRHLPFTQVDAFASGAFTGNPAAVFPLDSPLSAAAMQTIAAEMNLSETAFTAVDEGGRRWLRWFTPTAEVPLCGHATLATAHVLLEAGVPDPIRFDSASGVLTVAREGDGIRLDFPADPPSPARAPEGLLESLGCPPGTSVLQARNLWLVRLESREAVAALAPRFSAMGEVDLSGGLGVTVTAPAAAPLDFVSRFFAPWVGIDEDPVTGIAHTVLGPYWSGQLGRERLRARQISRRGGDVTVVLAGDRAHLIGLAVTVATGRMLEPGA